MSRNLNDWMIKSPIKGNRYKLWKLFPGSVFTVSTPIGPVPFQVLEQKGTLTKCLSGDKTTSMDSSVEVTYTETIHETVE
jgi:hypothetical protein